MEWQAAAEWPMDCAAFDGTGGDWGVFHPQYGKMELWINGVQCNSAEGLYQALKFVDSDDQYLILDNYSGFYSREEALGFKRYWDIDDDFPRATYLMHFALWMKTWQYSHYIVPFLRMSEGLDIVMVSKDKWGAVREEDCYYGVNAIGKLWMDIRKVLRMHEWQLPDPTAISGNAVLMNRSVWLH